MRVCRTCERTFHPSSGHLDCPACRSKDQCRCGNPKQVKSRTCAECRENTGSANGYWKGGRVKHHAGYVMVRVPAHPRATSGGGRYVFEHILVMERLLGRHLLPHETVHHRNGVKHDNRPENLELWIRPQPSGIRVEDAIAWAREILRRYAEEPGSPPTTL